MNYLCLNKLELTKLKNFTLVQRDDVVSVCENLLIDSRDFVLMMLSKLSNAFFLTFSIS